eukprot:TRINITY_DN136519_c0_g1_i1.p1 TRINITY_DN136519_c0_g1~~TRINITY_DN136519_c0_g1_i1.p1  ORF type:complete len:103 (+),score=17.84 TRINITY_DN136519_c0_g1_i1:124-432(+)
MSNRNAALVLIPDEESLEIIEGYREKYDKSYYTWPGHITFYWPFLPQKDFSKKMSQIQEIIQEIPSFTITFTGISYLGKQENNNNNNKNKKRTRKNKAKKSK